MELALLPLARDWLRQVQLASSTRLFRASSPRPPARRLRTCTTTWLNVRPEHRTRRIGLTTKSDRQPAVAIVGGGASGTILAAQLARRGVRSRLIDGSGLIGRGIAYSTIEPAHLLNVPAEAMSACSGDADHFASRFRSQGGNPSGFAQRRLFGRYLGEILDEAISSGCCEPVEYNALTAKRSDGVWRVVLDDGSSIDAKALVLAVGNQEPAPLGPLAGAGKRFVRNPWGLDARAAIGELTQSEGPVLLVGTGLTMIDLSLSLDAAGYQGRIVAMSRHGLIPRSHSDYEPVPVGQEDLPRQILELFRWLRLRSARFGWRAAIDSVRPYSHALWQGLESREQRRFLRHARPWWDVHRHRIAPEVAETIARLIGQGQLEIVAGRIVAAQDTPQGIEVRYQRRGFPLMKEMTFDYAFNCTGPLHSMTQSRNPILRDLLDAGKIRPDHLDIGLHVDEEDRAGDCVWALGPLTKGRYWEIIAVPDIRDQAARVADDIARELA